MRMKNLIVGTLVLLLFSSSTQAQEEIMKGVKSGFKSGNMSEMSPLLSSKVELAFEGEKRVYQKKDAESVLKDFFTNNKPKDFEILHQGASKVGLKFYIGEYKSASNTFRVLIYLRTKDDKSLIETIDISKE